MAQLLKTDVEKEQEGVWFDYPHVEGIRFKVARIGTPNYRRIVREEGAKLLAQYPDGDFPEDVNDRMRDVSVARACLLDWEGIDDTPYSEAQAIVYMTEPGYHDVSNFVYSRGGQRDSYLLNGEAKN